MSHSNLSRLTRSAMLVAVVAVCSQITIPLPSGVPVTLQTLAVALCGYLLGPLDGVLTLAVYLALGLMGVPVFSAFGAGFGILLGRTGGFLLGFLPMAFFCGLAGRQEKRLPQLLLGLPGLVLCHVAGVAQFSLLTGMGFWASTLLVSVPYLVKDVASVLFASRLALLLDKALRLRAAKTH